jgi:hypothetical protein
MQATEVVQAVVYSVLNLVCWASLVSIVIALIRPRGFARVLPFLGRPTRLRICGFMAAICFASLMLIGVM